VKLAEDAVSRSGDQTVALLAGRVFALTGRAPRALELAADLAKKLEKESQMYGKVLEGEVALKRGDARAAISSFEAARALADSWLARYGLGRAYVDVGAHDRAQTEFELCLAKRGEASTVLLDDIPTYRFLPAVRYYLGRVQEGLGGDPRESYRIFIAMKDKGDEQGLVADARRRLNAP
jgi:tetratricopeptide (TPR) repeat protein